MDIHKIKKEDFNNWLEMGLLLWSEYSKAELKIEFAETCKSKNEAVFICKDKENYVGFVNISLRYEYVPESTSVPTGYIEGIFVRKEYRKKRIAEKLVRIAEKWAKNKGCKEIASDTELDNNSSQKFHKKIGFKKTKTLVYFIKKI